jgi:serine/threonine-protein kinase
MKRNFDWGVAIVFMVGVIGCSSPSTDDGGGVDSGHSELDVASDHPVVPTDTPASDATGTDTPPAGDGGSLGPRGLFPATHFFYRDVSGMSAAPESDAIITQLEADGGWGNGNVFQIDFSIVVLSADRSTPTMRATSIDYATDSDDVPFPFPMGGALEGETGYACTGGGDCHLLVIEQDTRQLFEAWSVNRMGTTLTMGSNAVWNLDRDYGNTGRGLGCTSADAAGFPITPGLIRLDEVAAGEIDHALRFILPNDRMRRHAYVAPATHYGSPSNRNPDSIPYGTRLRLRAGFDESRVTSAGGRAVVRALKRYGMLLSDGGNIALTGESDQLSTQHWEFNGGTVPLSPRDLSMLQVGDFEVVDFGPVTQAFPIDNATNEWPDCVRAP